jgi:hypothetical protein
MNSALQKAAAPRPVVTRRYCPCPIIEILKEVTVNGAAAGRRDRRIAAKRQEPVSGEVAF